MHPLEEKWTRAEAKAFGSPTLSPALLRFHHSIRWSGIRRGRELHRARRARFHTYMADKIQVDGYFNLFRPVPFTDLSEVITHYKVARSQMLEAKALAARGMTVGYDAGKLGMYNERLVFARFLRRFSQRVWMRQAEAA